jgi:beta-mannosidase
MKKSILFTFLFLQIFTNAQFSERNLSSEKWKFKNSKENNWLTASVPGTVHLDLMNNKIIPNPYKDENEKKVQWIENENWDYQTSFNISSKDLENQNIELIFNGLDTFSEIYLNGKLIQSTDNMFRKWTIPVRQSLKNGENILQVKFRSAVNVGKELAQKVAYAAGFTGDIEWDSTKPDGTPRKVLDVSRIKALGWEPTITLGEGIASTITWYKEAIARGEVRK